MSEVKVTLINEFTTHAKEAIRLKKLIELSKTDAKKQFYKKKLHKNNVLALQLLDALQRLPSNPSTQEQNKDNETINVEQSS